MSKEIRSLLERLTHVYLQKKTTENNESWVLSVQWAGQNKVVSRTKPQIQQTMQVRGMFLI